MQPASEQYVVPGEYRQNYQMSEDLPFGSRGGTLIKHYFPADGEYTIKVDLERNIEGYIRGLRKKHIIDVRLDHEQIGSAEIGGEFFGRPGPIFTENQVVHYSGDPGQVGYEFTADEKLNYRFQAKAGDPSGRCYVCRQRAPNLQVFMNLSCHSPIFSPIRAVYLK